MNCSKYKKLLVEFADGRLDYQQSVELQSHIAQCETCKKELDNLKASLDILRADSVLMKEPFVPVNFVERVIGGIREREKSYDLYYNRLILNIAIIISILCLGFGLYLNLYPSKEYNDNQAYNMPEKSIKTELPKKVALLDNYSAKMDKQKSEKASTEISKNALIKKQTPKIESNSNQIKIQTKMELVNILGQTLELIKGDEKEWEIEI